MARAKKKSPVDSNVGRTVFIPHYALSCGSVHESAEDVAESEFDFLGDDDVGIIYEVTVVRRINVTKGKFVFTNE